MLITLNGASYRLCSSFTSLSRLEEELGISLITLAGRLADGHVMLKEIASILHHCLDTDIPRESIENALVQGGLEQGVQAVVAMLSEIFAGGGETAGDAGALTVEELNSLCSAFPDTDIIHSKDSVRTAP